MAKGDHIRVRRSGYWHHGIDCGDGEQPEAVGARLLSREDGLTRLHVEAAKGDDVRQAIFSQAVAKGWTLLEMRRDNTSLEDVFREFTVS